MYVCMHACVCVCVYVCVCKLYSYYYSNPPCHSSGAHLYVEDPKALYVAEQFCAVIDFVYGIEITSVTGEVNDNINKEFRVKNLCSRLFSLHRIIRHHIPIVAIIIIFQQLLHYYTAFRCIYYAFPLLPL
jgi:hypothetical protein